MKGPKIRTSRSGPLTIFFWRDSKMAFPHFAWDCGIGDCPSFLRTPTSWNFYFLYFFLAYSNIFSVFQSWDDFSNSPSTSSCSLTSNLASNNVLPVETSSLYFVRSSAKVSLKIEVSPTSLYVFHARWYFYQSLKMRK